MQAAEEALQAKEKVVLSLFAGLTVSLFLFLSLPLFVHLFGTIIMSNLEAPSGLMITLLLTLICQVTGVINYFT